MSEPRSRPNVLLIITDQQRTDTLGCYGAAHMNTPVIDRLAAGGVRFSRAYCNGSVCTPSRASLFSGWYPSRHGAWHVGTHVPDDVPLLSHRLGAAGYRTHYVGKAHFQSYAAGPEVSVESNRPSARYPDWTGPYYGFESVELCLGHSVYGHRHGHYGAWVRHRTGGETPAWELRHHEPRFGGEAIDWAMPTALHNSTWAGERAAAFLETAAADQPFFLTVSFQDPHHPHALPTDCPCSVDPATVPLPVRREGELADKPEHFADTARGEIEKWVQRGTYSFTALTGETPLDQLEDDAIRQSRAHYYGMVQLIDRSLATVMATLERRGLADNTLVIFTSDHGELLGDHGLWFKGPFHYEAIINVPLIMRWPAGLPAGRVVDAPVGLVDVVPSVLAAAQLDGDDSLDGESLLPVATGTGAGRNEAYVEFVDDPRRLRLRTVVIKDWKLTWYAGETFGELYDLAHDPREFVNRWDDPACATIKAQLLARLLNHTERNERREVRHAVS